MTALLADPIFQQEPLTSLPFSILTPFVGREY
jgi:hypothetical protein